MSGTFDFDIIFQSIPFLAKGMWLTLMLTIFGMLGGLFIGTLLALCRLSPFRFLSFAGGSYVNFFRSMPLILVIFWFYFLVPWIVGQPVGDFYSVMIAFILFEAAYYCEIMRAGIQSITMGQIYAGKALGLTYKQNMIHVVLPQAFRNMIPILLTQAIVLFQDTSLVYVVGLRDFLYSADIIANRDNRLVEMFVTVAIVYFFICLWGTGKIRNLQRKYST